jgi:hypothetical protein
MPAFKDTLSKDDIGHRLPVAAKGQVAAGNIQRLCGPGRCWAGIPTASVTIRGSGLDGVARYANQRLFPLAGRRGPTAHICLRSRLFTNVHSLGVKVAVYNVFRFGSPPKLAFAA